MGSIPIRLTNMPEKTCSRCRRPQSETVVFNVNNAKPDGLQAICRNCSRGGAKIYYLENKPRIRRQITKANIERMDRGREFVIEHLLKNPCVDCGEGDVIVLEFDHVRGEKIDNVSQLVNVGCGVDKIREEIAKCEVRCANCHRRKTAKTHWRLLNTIAKLTRA